VSTQNGRVIIAMTICREISITYEEQIVRRNRTCLPISSRQRAVGGRTAGEQRRGCLLLTHTHACMLSAHIARAPPSPLSRVDSLTAKNITRRLPPHWGCAGRRGISVQYSHRRQRHRGRRGHVPADSWSTGDELHYIAGNVCRVSAVAC